eukprot:6527858-Prymnesium_polylepis.1
MIPAARRGGLGRVAHAHVHAMGGAMGGAALAYQSHGLGRVAHEHVHAMGGALGGAALATRAVPAPAYRRSVDEAKASILACMSALMPPCCRSMGALSARSEASRAAACWTGSAGHAV